MATDELTESSTIPPYPEMILSAIEALDEKEGSSKSSISDYIESKYAEQLPEAHPALLAEYLQQMKESGEVGMVKNNYTKPDPAAAPAKRGRGRPPKPKPELPPGTVLPPPRPRGRPPKDPLAAAVAKVAKGFGGKPRGRPPKKPRTTDGEDESPSVDAAEPPAAASAVAATPPSGVKRGRGRPPKVKPPFADVGFA